MKKETSGVNLPSFRYIEDFTRYLDKMEEEVRDTEQLIKKQEKLIAKSFLNLKLTAGSFVFDVSPTDRKTQLKEIKKMRQTSDIGDTKVVIKDLAKVKEQYSLVEDLYDKHKALEAMETQLQIQFPDRRGELFKNALASIKELKGKVEKQLRQTFQFLNEVASKHVPTGFAKYMDAIVELVEDHVIFKKSELFLYVSVDNEGNLLFTYYLMLLDAVNDEGVTTPNLYISVQWRYGKQVNDIKVQLDHEYEVPNRLAASGGMEVESVGDAVKAISKLLDLEHFSSALGIVPLALQLKMDPSKISPELFSYRDLISKVSIEGTDMTFTLRPEAASEKVAAEVAAMLYTEVKGLLKSKAKISLLPMAKQGKSHVITFRIQKLAERGEFTNHDAEFLRERFNLSDAAMSKIVNILNQG